MKHLIGEEIEVRRVGEGELVGFRVRFLCSDLGDWLGWCTGFRR
jgi:hypothetical protein